MANKSKEQVYKEIRESVGFVPTFMKRISDDAIESEWQLFHQELDDDYGVLGPKVRELIGLAVASSIQCPYCIDAHTQFSKLFGATDEELEDAVHTAKNTAGWSTYIAGLDTDLEEFRTEISRACNHMQKNL